MADRQQTSSRIPSRSSWSRWPPNCCETCVGWMRTDQYSDYTGTCHRDNSLDFGTTTDSRYRCPAFQRRPDT